MSGNAHLDAIVRESRRSRRLPSQAECTVCGTRDQLIVSAGSVRCYGCSVAPRVLERDHIAGVGNLPLVTVALTPNGHRRVTEIRSLVGMDGWVPAEGDLLLIAAYVLGGLASLLHLLAEWLHRFATWQRSGVADPPPFPFPL